MHTFLSKTNEIVYHEGGCSSILPVAGRVKLKFMCRHACLVEEVHLRVLDSYGICTGGLVVAVSSDKNGSRLYTMDIEKDVLVQKALCMKVEPPLEVDRFLYVDIAADYDGQGVLCVLQGLYGWAATIHGMVEEAFILERLPKVSVVMPVHGVEPDILEKALLSVSSQHYTNWRLSAYVASSEKALLNTLKRFSERNKERVRIVEGLTNRGISSSTNEAIAAADKDTEVYAFMDCDDELHPAALLNVAKVFVDHSDAALVYTDEDKIDEHGALIDPHFKPNFSKEMLFCQNYPCHLTCVASSVIERLKPVVLRSEYDGAQDHDFWLRCTDFVDASSVIHIPRVLYHWRKSEGSVARSSSSKSWAYDAGLKAVRDHFASHDPRAFVYRGAHFGTYRVRKEVEFWPEVHVVIPTHDNVEMLESNLRSLASTSYEGAFFVHAVANRCSKECVSKMQEMLEHGLISTLQTYEGEFNWSAINNSAVDSIFYAKKGCTEINKSVLVFMNDDIEAMDPWWLDEMVRELWQYNVGVVGAKLLYPDMRLQHAGVVIGMGGIAGHAHKRLVDFNPGYFCRPHIVQQLSAVTGACMAARVDVFLGVGGFEEKLPKAFNDIDFCLKVRSAGYSIVYTPWARLIHHESVSRGLDPGNDPVFQAAVKFMEEKWHCSTYKDPFFNPNLDLMSEIFHQR